MLSRLTDGGMFSLSVDGTVVTTLLNWDFIRFWELASLSRLVYSGPFIIRVQGYVEGMKPKFIYIRLRRLFEVGRCS